MAKKILVVDDDPVIVKYLVNIFDDNGYETCSAGGGIEAYEVLQKEKPDLITLDLEMPDEWGPKFFRKIQKDKDFKDVPVIVISGLASSHLAIKKAVATITKPFDPDKVLAVIRRTLGE